MNPSKIYLGEDVKQRVPLVWKRMDGGLLLCCCRKECLRTMQESAPAKNY
jgi:hypothetical protein